MKIEIIKNSSESAAVLADDIHPDSGTQSNNETITASAAKSSTFNGVEDIRATLGEHAVLLPIPSGTKIPILKGWPSFTAEKMQDGDYLKSLEGGNIGVVLGRASGGICAIDIDHDAWVQPFLDLNPDLSTSLRTRGARGVQIWVRCSSDYPKNAKLQTVGGEAWGEWRADGNQSVIHGIHPLDHAYTVQHRAEPLNIKFEDIKWPGELVLPWDTPSDELVNEVGDALITGKNGDVRINHSYWVHKYMLEHDVVFDSSLGKFYEYEEGSGLWVSRTDDTLRRNLLKDLQQTAKTEGLPQLHFKLTDGLGTSLAGLLRTMTEDFDIFSRRKKAIHTKSGMLSIRDEGKVTLEAFHPSFYSRNACPFEFDPHADCPRFKDELLAEALEPDDITLMQRWSGACLLGQNPAHRFLLLTGAAGAGKSTFMNIIERVIGLQNVTQLRTDHLDKQFELYNFIGKTLLSGKDVSSDFLLNKNAHIIKALVGGDLLTAEKKNHSEPIQIRGSFNIGICCNSDLNIRLEGDVDAWRRRLMIVRYERQPVRRTIPNFTEELLREEGSGILTWMVHGAVALIQEQTKYGGYRLSQQQQDRIDELLAQSDSVRFFVDQMVEKTVGESLTVTNLKTAYLRFCDDFGWIPLCASVVSEQMPKAMLGIGCRQRNDAGENKTQKGYYNVRLRMVPKGNA